MPRSPRSSEGNEAPSIEWRRDFSLMLGLERLLSEEEPHLADGAELSAHQVDALSGTLAALIADVQERINGHAWTGNGDGSAPSPSATKDEASGNGAGAEVDEEDLEEEEEEATEEEEAEDWTGDEDEDVVEEAPRTLAPTAASGSSTPPAPARPSPRSASSKPRGRAAS